MTSRLEDMLMFIDLAQYSCDIFKCIHSHSGSQAGRLNLEEKELVFMIKKCLMN